MKRSLSPVALVLPIALAAACAANPPPVADPAPPSNPVAPAGPTGSVAAAPPAEGPHGPHGDEPGKRPPPEEGGRLMQATTMREDVKKLGIDFTKPLSALPMDAKKKVMKYFVKSLGYSGCSGCHAPTDFAAKTHNVKLADQMWDQFVVQLRDEKKEPIFCDSCHAGQATILHREKHEAVGSFMHAEYTDKLTRADGQANKCASCHGEKFEPHIFEKKWGIASK